MAKFLRKEAYSDNDPGPDLSVPETGRLFSKLEALFEFLSLAEWDDGTVREKGTLIVFCEDGMWKGCLSDRESERTAFMTGITFEELLEALDKGLRKESLDWRRKKQPTDQKGRKK